MSNTNNFLVTPAIGVPLTDQELKQKLNEINYVEIYNQILKEEHQGVEPEFISSELNSKETYFRGQLSQKDSYTIKYQEKTYNYYVKWVGKKFNFFWIVLLTILISLNILLLICSSGFYPGPFIGQLGLEDLLDAVRIKVVVAIKEVGGNEEERILDSSKSLNSFGFGVRFDPNKTPPKIMEKMGENIKDIIHVLEWNQN
ncbi:hypothetical protein SCLARK_001657 [Spiroplasma clarkii]|uniref:hypothetical protein n=1 Tax=Spiroplasma clarkii TaxID=2139 RepID=UPI000B579E46|nr:hypothetical protein [Spiroplasma clarkii]ARU92125.1 hypothetical protein SCLARK_001657 [Spiroplasma clarkii]